MMICMCCDRLMYLGTYRNFPVSQSQNYLCQITSASIKTYYQFYFSDNNFIVEIFIKQIAFTLLIYFCQIFIFQMFMHIGLFIVLLSSMPENVLSTKPSYLDKSSNENNNFLVEKVYR